MTEATHLAQSKRVKEATHLAQSKHVTEATHFTQSKREQRQLSWLKASA
jgi:hypothetical protein